MIALRFVSGSLEGDVLRETFGDNAAITEFIPSIGDLVRDDAVTVRRVVDRMIEYHPHGTGADVTVTVVLEGA